MRPKSNIGTQQKNLILRYLLWCYKTTRESLERVDRKFTQLEVDYQVLDLLQEELKSSKGKESLSYEEKVAEFKSYIARKEEGSAALKYQDVSKKILTPDYWYLTNRLQALEKTVITLLGERELKKIRSLYEIEMTRRILEAREHT